MRRLMRTTVEGYGLTPCVYCGLTATARDHFVPRAWRKMMERWREGCFVDVPDTVPCCTQCNSIAGANVFRTLAEKRQYIQARLRDKNAKLLASEFWPHKELRKLGKTLRSHIEKRETERLRLLLRLAWPYNIENEVEALTRALRDVNDPESALNQLRRKELLS